MKSYGKPDASWDEAKFRAVIKDMLEMARESKKSCAVGQDRHGNVVVMMAEGKDDSCTYLCWTCAHRNKESHEDELELVDNVEYHHYSVEEMVSKVRDALTKRIVEYGGLRFLSEGRFQIGEAAECANTLAKTHREPFIVGLTDAGITVAPMSERGRFVEQAACVAAGHWYWSLADRIPDGEEYRDLQRRERRTPSCKIVSDSRSIRVNPVHAIYRSTLEYWKQRREQKRQDA